MDREEKFRTFCKQCDYLRLLNGIINKENIIGWFCFVADKQFPPKERAFIGHYNTTKGPIIIETFNPNEKFKAPSQCPFILEWTL